MIDCLIIHFNTNKDSKVYCFICKDEFMLVLNNRTLLRICPSCNDSLKVIPLSFPEKREIISFILEQAKDLRMANIYLCQKPYMKTITSLKALEHALYKLL